mmetsp:Transcript_31029/g.69904  ORF Transcript_31029/g.69904 Transcript_31029/m.69904 type:complete len:80 (+) Transcript_31029:25-264(+)
MRRQHASSSTSGVQMLAEAAPGLLPPNTSDPMCVIQPTWPSLVLFSLVQDAPRAALPASIGHTTFVCRLPADYCSYSLA